MRAVRPALSVPLVVLLFAANLAGEEWKISVTVDFGKDIGQNPGSLFEIQDDTGRAVFGAGFPAIWNTQSRINRRSLSVFVVPQPGDWKARD